jgi:hypothetical protein
MLDSTSVGGGATAQERDPLSSDEESVPPVPFPPMSTLYGTST